MNYTEQMKYNKKYGDQPSAAIVNASFYFSDTDHILARSLEFTKLFFRNVSSASTILGKLS